MPQDLDPLEESIRKMARIAVEEAMFSSSCEPMDTSNDSGDEDDTMSVQSEDFDNLGTGTKLLLVVVLLQYIVS